MATIFFEKPVEVKQRYKMTKEGFQGWMEIGTEMYEIFYFVDHSFFHHKILSLPSFGQKPCYFVHTKLNVSAS